MSDSTTKKRSRTHVTCTVNGDEVDFLASDGTSLLDALRDELGLTGAKEGCGTGDCGTCTVLVNGRINCSCLMFAPEAEGSDIVTVEGIAEGAPQFGISIIRVESATNQVSSLLFLSQKTQTYYQWIPKFDLLEQLERSSDHADAHELLAQLFLQSSRRRKPSGKHVTHTRRNLGVRSFECLNQIFKYQERTFARARSITFMPGREHSGRRAKNGL